MNKDKQHSYFISDELLYQFQEYGFDLFGGEAAAVDEFFKKHEINPSIKKFSFSDNSGGYVIKEQR